MKSIFNLSWFGIVSTSVLVASQFASQRAMGGSVSAGDRRFPPAIKIEFISIGAGIDTVYYKNFKNLAAKYLKSGVVLSFSNRGVEGAIEGEVNTCIEMIDGAKMQEFLNALNATTKPLDIVRFESAKNCL